MSSNPLRQIDQDVALAMGYVIGCGQVYPHMVHGHTLYYGLFPPNFSSGGLGWYSPEEAMNRCKYYTTEITDWKEVEWWMKNNFTPDQWLEYFTHIIDEMELEVMLYAGALEGDRRHHDVSVEMGKIMTTPLMIRCEAFIAALVNTSPATAPLPSP